MKKENERMLEKYVHTYEKRLKASKYSTNTHLEDKVKTGCAYKVIGKKKYEKEDEEVANEAYV